MDLIRGAEAMLEAVPRTEILELRLDHRAEIAGRVVPELDNATGIVLEDDHHAASDLRSRKCHGS
jgi:hypothetical protein